MKWRSVNEYILGVLLIGYMWLIFYLSSIPGTQLRLPTPDYIAHALAFGGLSLITTLFLIYHLSLKSSIFFSLILTFLFALSDEAHQYFVPFRSPDWRDIAADLVGAFGVQILLIVILLLYFSLVPKAGQGR